MDTCGIVATPGTAFGPRGEGYIRMALVLPAETLTEMVGVIRDNFPFNR